jgi:hypothetical protein
MNPKLVGCVVRVRVGECGKFGFFTRQDAIDGIDQIKAHHANKKRNPKIKRLTVYSCRSCGYWHHTTINPRFSWPVERRKVRR